MSKTYDIPEEVQAVDRMTATIAKLEAQNAALLAALRALVGHCTKADGPWLKVVRPSLDSVTQARAAIERNS